MEDKVKEKFAFGILIFSIIALVILIFSAVSQTKVTGKVIENIEETKTSDVQGKFEISCADSDDGRKYSLKGTLNYCNAQGECSIKEDSCSGKKLTELYCENNEMKSEEYECDCYEGVCLNQVKDYKYSYTTSGGSGGGGGSISSGSGGNGFIGSGQTHELGVISSENTLEVAKDENIGFINEDKTYLLVIKDNTPTQVTFINGAQTFVLTVGKDEKIDLDNDSVPELNAKIRSINIINGKIKLTLSPA